MLLIIQVIINATFCSSATSKKRFYYISEMTSTNDDDEIDLTVTDELMDSLQVTFWPGSEVAVTHAQPLGRSVVTSTLLQPDPQTHEPEQNKETDRSMNRFFFFLFSSPTNWKFL